MPTVEEWMLILLLLMLAGAVAGMFLLYRRNQHLLRRCEHAEEQHDELSGFVARFSQGKLGENEVGVAGIMHVTARHIADVIDAEGVALYELVNDRLVPVGVSGRYRLVHAADEALLTKHGGMWDVLKGESIPVGEGFLGEVAAHGCPELVEAAGRDPRFQGYPLLRSIGSVMAVPVVGDGRLIGVLCAVNNQRRPGKSFSQIQYERFLDLPAQVAVACGLVGLYSRLNERDRIDQELVFTRQLQMALLPKEVPDFPPFLCAAHTRPSREVNGDFYDFVRIDNDRLLVLLGDACGKGLPACLLTSVTRSFARGMADKFTTLSNFLIELNAKLYRDTDADRFVTLGCCLLDKKNETIEFGRAGHTDLVAFVHGHCRAFSPQGSGLGILPSDFTNYDTICIAFQPGTTLMLFSDGLSEALDTSREEFGVARLTNAFEVACKEHEDTEAILSDIMERVVDYEAEQNDDQTLVIIRHA